MRQKWKKKFMKSKWGHPESEESENVYGDEDEYTSEESYPKHKGFGAKARSFKNKLFSKGKPEEVKI
jgi:hypothetical protein